jgi:hypothetical protein
MTAHAQTPHPTSPTPSAETTTQGTMQDPNDAVYIRVVRALGTFSIIYLRYSY